MSWSRSNSCPRIVACCLGDSFCRSGHYDNTLLTISVTMSNNFLNVISLLQRTSLIHMVLHKVLLADTRLEMTWLLKNSTVSVRMTGEPVGFRNDLGFLSTCRMVFAIVEELFTTEDIEDIASPSRNLVVQLLTDILYKKWMAILTVESTVHFS